jgi:hypothetical protein
MTHANAVLFMCSEEWLYRDRIWVSRTAILVAADLKDCATIMPWYSSEGFLKILARVVLAISINYTSRLSTVTAAIDHTS